MSGLGRMRREDGFTLLELLVVILVIGILIAVALPSFLGQTDKARDSAAKQRLDTAYKAAKADSLTTEDAAQGTYRTSLALVNAITSSEPQLDVVEGVPSEGEVGVLESSSPETLQLASRSDSGRMFQMTVPRNGAPQLVNRAYDDFSDPTKQLFKLPYREPGASVYTASDSQLNFPGGLPTASNMAAFFTAGKAETWTVSAEYRSSAANANGMAGVVLKYVESSNRYLMFRAVAGDCRITVSDGNTFTDLDSETDPYCNLSTDGEFQITASITGNTVTASIGQDPSESYSTTYMLTGADAAAFGTGVEGLPGLNMNGEGIVPGDVYADNFDATTPLND